MPLVVTYSSRERFWLWTVAIVTGIGLNAVFLYGSAANPQVLRQAVTNPVAAAFILEALLLMFVLAYLLGKWGVSRVSISGFVVLSLVGGVAFALPVALLWRRSDA
jgi:Kef-type K+ transport system membrane component KefB